MKLFSVKVLAALVIAVVFMGCATVQEEKQVAPVVTSNDLRVGVTPDLPPVIFRQNDEITGIESELSRKLAEELKRPVRFVALPWEDEIPALLDNRIDIIMSGMTATKARGIRIAFSESYLKSGLIAMMRAEDGQKYTSKDSILNGYVTVGAVKDTTGDAFVKRNFPNAVRKAFLRNPKDGINELKRRAIDIFIYDAPSAAWFVSENEADITALWEPLTEEYLAWGIRKNDQKLLTDVNSILLRWKQDGTLDAILAKWLPAEYLKRIH